MSLSSVTPKRIFFSWADGGLQQPPTVLRPAAAQDKPPQLWLQTSISSLSPHPKKPHVITAPPQANI